MHSMPGSHIISAGNCQVFARRTVLKLVLIGHAIQIMSPAVHIFFKKNHIIDYWF